MSRLASMYWSASGARAFLLFYGGKYEAYAYHLIHPPGSRPPTLLLHSDGDTAVPVELSRDLAAAAPGLDWPVTYREFAGTEHTGSWNADPEGYEAAVTGFLGAVLRTGLR